MPVSPAERTLDSVLYNAEYTSLGSADSAQLKTSVGSVGAVMLLKSVVIVGSVPTVGPVGGVVGNACRVDVSNVGTVRPDVLNVIAVSIVGKVCTDAVGKAGTLNPELANVNEVSTVGDEIEIVGADARADCMAPSIPVVVDPSPINIP